MKAFKFMTKSQIELLIWALSEAINANTEMADDGQLSSVHRFYFTKAKKLLNDAVAFKSLTFKAP